MDALLLHEFHRNLGARFLDLNGMEAVESYGEARAEYAALRESVGVLDLSFRGRLCVLGADRRVFLNGQVTNNVKDLKTGEGCYAALVTARGKMESDLNIYCLENELLLDFEPGLGATVCERLAKHIIAEDAQVVEVAPHYGLLSAQGPRAAEVLRGLGLPIPPAAMGVARMEEKELGEIYVVNQPRIGTVGFDLFAPTATFALAAEKLLTAARAAGGRGCGWTALETARIEAAIPRFGADMDNTTLPPEAGLDNKAVSYSKGCYIGQEIIARIRTYGQVARTLRGLRLADGLPALPARGDKLFHGEKEAGFITSATTSPALKANIALGYVRREANQIGTELEWRTGGAKFPARIVELPFLGGHAPAIFLDRDGTLIEEKEYLHRPEEVAVFPGAGEALRRLSEAGFKLFIVSNQSGVGRGRFTLEDVAKVNARLTEELAGRGVGFVKIYVAPEAPEQPSRGRKPSPQFLWDARDEFGIRLEESYFIGDKLIDLECGWNAGVKKSVLVRTGYGREVERSGDPRLASTVVVDDLSAAAAWILQQRK